MREKLEEIGSEKRFEYTSTFQKFGIKSGYKSSLPTFIVTNVKDNNGRLITDHLWLNFTTVFNQFGWLQPGDIVKFSGRVDTYYKGYHKNQLDYRLTYPSKVSVIRNGAKLEKSSLLRIKRPYELADEIANRLGLSHY